MLRIFGSTKLMPRKSTDIFQRRACNKGRKAPRFMVEFMVVSGDPTTSSRRSIEPVHLNRRVAPGVARSAKSFAPEMVSMGYCRGSHHSRLSTLAEPMPDRCLLPRENSLCHHQKSRFRGDSYSGERK